MTRIEKITLFFRGMTSAGLLTLGLVVTLFLLAYPAGWVSAYPPVPPAHVDTGKTIKPATRNVSASDLRRGEGEELNDYYARLASDVFDGTARFWNVAETWTPSDAIYTRVSPWHNYLLWAYSFLPGHQHFAQYEFATPQKALDRGYGVCSQVARIVYYTLRAQGIPATLKSQPSHVLVEVDGGIVDANYGIFVPHTIDDLKSNPDLVTQYYTTIPEEAEMVANIFSEANGPWFDASDSHSVLSYMYNVEQVARILKWFPALFLIAAGLFLAPLPYSYNRR